MKKIHLLMVVLTLIAISQMSFGQGQSQRFKMEGINPETITINQTFNADAEIFPFPKNLNKVFGVAVTADIVFNDEGGVVRFLFVDKDYVEHLIYEVYPLLEGTEKLSVTELSEETALLNGLKAYSVKIEITDARVEIKSLTWTKALGKGVYSEQKIKEKKQEQNEEKINKINKNLKEKGMHWVAGPTEVSEMTYSERKQLYGQSTFPAGFEYYCGGIISTASEGLLKSATASNYADKWDWRDRHGKNWISPVTNQGACGSCWAFAAVGATEAMVNLYFNQLLNLDLSEQDVLSCSGGGTCGGGYPSSALNYITKTGIVDENTFPYNGIYQPCENKGNTPSELIKISGRIDFGLSLYPREEDNLKKMIIQQGPLSSALSDWNHAIVLAGYQVVQEGDVFFFRDLNLQRYWKTVEPGNPLIGKTVWIFKNSWGEYFGDEGYIYVETALSNITNTHAVKTQIVSLVKKYDVICEDRDGDGYYWWGLGPKPLTCNCPDTPDGDDSDPTLGPLDQYGNCIKLSNAPVANFSVSKTVITKGETVTFNDLSTNMPTSWSWSFAGGTPSTSTAKNPAVSYATAGTYQVSLIATNASGSNTKTVTNYIQVTEPVVAPMANFSASKTIITKGETLTFTDLSTNTPTSWSWSFAGGTPSTSTSKNPAVTYSTAGTYKVVLTATNSAGSNTKTAENYIQVNEPVLAPVANFSVSKTVITKGETVTFTDLSTNSPTSWSWSLAGGTPSTSTSKNPAVTYSTAGTYKVVLTATNSAGSNTKTVENYIQVNEPVLAPVANFSVSKTVITKGETVTFNDLSTNTPTLWSWSFAGGTPLTSTLQNPALTYSTAGTYKVVLTATNSAGSNTKTVENYIQVNEPVLAPVAEFEAVKTSVFVGENVQLTDLSQNAPTQWEWLFPGGNPSISTEQNPKVTYNAAGEYDVTLTVSKPGVASSNKTKSRYIVTVQNIPTDYCKPVAISSSPDFISSVAIGNVLNSTSSGSGYSLDGNLVSLAPGKSYSVTLTPKVSANRNFWKIWFDFNGDYDFNDAGENVVTVSNKKGAVKTSFTVPQYATGTTRMRIAMRNLLAPGECDDNYKGEVEDYPVSFEMAASLGNETAELTAVADTDSQDINESAEIIATAVKNVAFGISDIFKCYPNPVNQLLNVQLDAVQPGDFYTIYNINGGKVVSEHIISTLTTVDFGNYSPGVYLLRILNGERVYNERIIKK
jgi:PKD repeat protein